MQSRLGYCSRCLALANLQVREAQVQVEGERESHQSQLEELQSMVQEREEQARRVEVRLQRELATALKEQQRVEAEQNMLKTKVEELEVTSAALSLELGENRRQQEIGQRMVDLPSQVRNCPAQVCLVGPASVFCCASFSW